MYPPPPDLDALYRSLFGSPKAGTGRKSGAPIRPRPRSDGPGQDSGDTAAEPLLDGETAGKEATVPVDRPKVILRNLAWGADKARFNERVTLRLQGEVPPGLSHLTRLEITVLALLPDGGRETIDRKEIHLKDGHASGEVTVFYPHAREEGGNLLTACDFVFTAKHRESAEAESPKLPVTQPLITNVRWEKAEEWFGVPVKLLATTCLKDGEEVLVKVASENGMALETKAKAKRGRLEVVWTPCLCGVAAGEDGKYPERVEYYAQISKGEEKAAPERSFYLKAVRKTEYETFSKDMIWGKYGVHSHFRQRIENGIADVRVPRRYMKAWAGILMDMTDAGFQGTVAGCPFERKRWARIVGRGKLPNQYHDGKNWQLIPDWFVPMDEDVIFLGFIRKGNRFVLGNYPTAIWPDEFLEYDFNRADFLEKRKAWKKDTETRWSRKFKLRPATCRHGTGSGGCGYPLDLFLEWEETKDWKPNTVAICRGDFRSNTSCFAMGDPDVSMVAHEVGHYVGMPDEYEGGALDNSLQGDGAVNGIDPSSIMGDWMDLIKRRHYANFAQVAGTLVLKATGKRIGFEPSEE